MQMQMHTLRRFCVLVAVGHSVLGLYNKFLRFSLCFFFFMDFPSTFKFLTQASELGCGFVLLSDYSHIFNLIGLILIFAFCFKLLRLTEFRALPRSRSPPKTPALEPHSSKGSVLDDGVVEDKDENLEDEMFDVMSLRKLVKFERQRFHAACAEIEKERSAASSAAEEAMAMILRLQSEKSSVEIQANQFRRMVEQKQEYDQEVIESLRWTVRQLEYQKSVMEEQVLIYREKLREYMRDDEIEQIEGVDAARDFCNFSVEYDLDASLETLSQSPHSC